MSSIPPIPDATGVTGLGGQQAGGPSEEEVRAYLEQMRTAPVEQVLAEVLQGLLNAAQLKLGRADARLLLDVAASITDQSRSQLSEDLVQQVDQALSQLRMAQVEAEQQVAAQGTPEANDMAADAPSATPDAGTDAPAASEPQPGSPGSATSKLWIPGR